LKVKNLAGIKVTFTSDMMATYLHPTSLLTPELKLYYEIVKRYPDEGQINTIKRFLLVGTFDDEARPDEVEDDFGRRQDEGAFLAQTLRRHLDGLLVTPADVIAFTSILDGLPDSALGCVADIESYKQLCKLASVVKAKEKAARASSIKTAKALNVRSDTFTKIYSTTKCQCNSVATNMLQLCTRDKPTMAWAPICCTFQTNPPTLRTG